MGLLRAEKAVLAAAASAAGWPAESSNSSAETSLIIRFIVVFNAGI
jgi:hypothetical protein